MSFFQLKSTNKDLGYVIHKNPSSGMKVSRLKAGHTFGYFTVTKNDSEEIINPQEYNVVNLGVSYDKEASHIDPTQYNSAGAIADVITEYFGAAMSKPQEKDDEKSTHTFVVHMVQINEQKEFINRISAFLKFNTTIEPIVDDNGEILKGNCKMTITYTGTLLKLLSYLYLFGSILHCVVNKPDYVDVGVVDKTLKIAELLDAPYHVIRQIIARMMRGRKTFNKFKPQIETILKRTHSHAEVLYGNSAMKRRDYIEDVLKGKKKTFEHSIVDIGCGDGFYAIPYSKKMIGTKLTYRAINIDEKELETLSKKIKKGSDNGVIYPIWIYPDIDVFLQLETWSEPFDIILTEVIEHMDKAEAVKFVKLIVTNIPFRKFIITTPDSEFNVHIGMQTKFRHDDHKWEPTKQEFREFMAECFKGFETQYELSFCQIGDILGKDSVTQGVVISKKLITTQ